MKTEKKAIEQIEQRFERIRKPIMHEIRNIDKKGKYRFLYAAVKLTNKLFRIKQKRS